MRDVTLGQYYPSDSVIHKLDPRIKLLLTIAYITSIFFIDSFVGFGVMFILLFSMIALSKVPFLKVLRSLRAILFLLFFTVILTVLLYKGSPEDLLWQIWIIRLYKSSLINSSMLILRIVFLVLGPSVLTLTTTPVELTDALERLLKPLSYIKLPVHELAIIMQIALRLIPTLVEETDKIISAQKARGAEFESGNLFKRAKALLPVLIPLFVSSFRRADELAYAMDSRCYRGAKGRTRMKIMKLKLKDFAALFVFALLFCILLILRYNWFDFGFIDMLKSMGGKL